MSLQDWLAGIATTAGLGWAAWMSLAMVGVKGDLKVIRSKLKIKNGG